MYKPIILIFLLLASVTCFAAKRTKTEAEAIAKSFGNSKLALRNLSSDEGLRLAYACYGDGISLRSTAESAYYYVFNLGNEQGFIIISGDDRASDILGYSDAGSFDIDAIPQNFRNWLGYYQTAIEMLEDMPETRSQSVELQSDEADFPDKIEPLLGKIAWGQREPFNALCPIIPGTDTRTIAGCVATAMAQIMKYYEWPQKGKGSKSYITEKHRIKLNVDFSQTTYDWANMLDTYTGNENEAQKNAVATLTYHCGVAAEMNYSYESGALQQTAARGMKDYFSYSNAMMLYDRTFYTSAEWYAMMKSELSAARPLFYVGGSDKNTAHAFLCDGYDSNGLFHINWGWLGSSDGYFNISIVEPSNMAGYNGAQNMIAGIYPAKGTMPAPDITMFTTNGEDGTTVSLTSYETGRYDSTTYVTYFYHTCVSNFSGIIAAALYDDTTLVELLHCDTMKGMAGYSGYMLIDTIAISDRIQPGKYSLYPAYSADGIRWKRIISPLLKPVGIWVNVGEQRVSYSLMTDNMPVLELTNLKTVNDFYAQYTYGSIEATIRNTGKTEAYTSISFMLLPVNVKIDEFIAGTTTQFFSNQVDSKYIMLLPGEKKTITFTPAITVSSGRYNLYIIERKAYNFLNKTSPYRITVLAQPALQLTEQIAFDNNAAVQYGDTLTVNIFNNGADFQGYVFADLSNAADGELYESLSPIEINVKRNGIQTLEIPLKGTKELLGDYTLQLVFSTNKVKETPLFSFTPEKYATLNFTVTDASATTPVSTGITLYPNPASDVLVVNSAEPVNRITVFDLKGQNVVAVTGSAGTISIPVHHLPSGVYILRCETAQKVYTQKFIKQ
ncbi:MAG: thiol protease/hemagglutinin PrtT [Tannerella sp.]|jgi:hypothetical protein|nr:thiol protease/hemagglutinin PrtT [Tannerella sp.]